VFVLVLDTSSAAVTVGVAQLGAGVEQFVTRSPVSARGHGELLAPTIEQCLAQLGISAGSLGAIVAGVGPGPFTGLRVGLVTAASLGHALGIPTYGVCSLDGIAGAAPVLGAAVGGSAPSGLLVAGDARRREVYWARYVAGARVTEPAVARPADVPLAGCGAMAGAGARLYADVFGLPLLEPDYPSAHRLLELATPRVLAGAVGETLTPLYLRRPDAVEPGPPKAVTA
jgi:tRNA threonylcarbamoyl adenosine modification protein YeaZ